MLFVRRRRDGSMMLVLVLPAREDRPCSRTKRAERPTSTTTCLPFISKLLRPRLRSIER